jgi:hypothetical protein
VNKLLTAVVDFTFDENIDCELKAWTKRYAKGCTTRVRRVNGGGGWPEVEISSYDRDALRAALIAFCGGDADQADEYLS